MLLSTLGSIGVGLVWGWLGGNLFYRKHEPFRAAVALLPATLLLSVSVWWLSDWRGVSFFLTVALFSFLLHSAWRQELRKH